MTAFLNPKFLRGLALAALLRLSLILPAHAVKQKTAAQEDAPAHPGRPARSNPDSVNRAHKRSSF
jgi:hypothetical protein